MKHNYEPDLLDEIAADRVKTDPRAMRDWEAIKIVTALRQEREVRGLTQAQIASRMGIPQSNVARIERRPWGTSFSRILAYAAAIGVSMVIESDEERALGA